MKVIEIYREDNPTLSFVIKKENDDGEMAALDLTGKDGFIFLICRKELEDNTALYDKAVTIDNAAEGQCSVSFTRAETLALYDGSDFQAEAYGRGPICELVYREGNDETTYEQFRLKIIPDVRRT